MDLLDFALIVWIDFQDESTTGPINPVYKLFLFSLAMILNLWASLARLKIDHVKLNRANFLLKRQMTLTQKTKSFSENRVVFGKFLGIFHMELLKLLQGNNCGKIKVM